MSEQYPIGEIPSSPDQEPDIDIFEQALQENSVVSGMNNLNDHPSAIAYALDAIPKLNKKLQDHSYIAIIRRPELYVQVGQERVVPLESERMRDAAGVLDEFALLNTARGPRIAACLSSYVLHQPYAIPDFGSLQVRLQIPMAEIESYTCIDTPVVFE